MRPANLLFPEHRVHGADIALPLVEVISAIRSHSASRITWHKHARFELLVLLEGCHCLRIPDEPLGRAVERRTAEAGSSAASRKQAVPYLGYVKIFNGASFEGWEAEPSRGSIADGAMRGTGGTSRMACTKADYGSFRLIFTSRMNPANGDHPGVVFWGDPPQDVARPKTGGAGWIMLAPPSGWMWDYHPPKGRTPPPETLVKGPKDFTQWSTTEILCHLEKGTMRVRVNAH